MKSLKIKRSESVLLIFLDNHQDDVACKQLSCPGTGGPDLEAETALTLTGTGVGGCCNTALITCPPPGVPQSAC